MKRFMTGACWSAAPQLLSSVVAGLIACVWTFGIAPPLAHAQYAESSGQSETGQDEPSLGASFFGFPMENGHVKWPIGLWLLVSDESEGSRDQLELAMDYAARQAAKGKVNHVAIAFGLDAVQDLRQQLRQTKGMISTGSYAEAVRYLNRAERGFTRMKLIDSSLRGASRDKGMSAGRVTPSLRGERRLSEKDE